MSARYWRASEYIAWLLWAVAGCLLITLFNMTGQDGLLFGQLVGLLSTSLGLGAVLLQKNQRATVVIQRAALSVAVVLVACGVWAAGRVLMDVSLYRFEWLSATLACCASFLLASRSKVSGAAWLFWVAANGIGVVTSIYREQYGLTSLNLVFTAINLVGVWRWLGVGLSARNSP